MSYSEKYLKHFQNPQNVGEIPDPDGAAEVRHEGGGCFDRIKMTLKIEDGKIADAKYKLRACSGTIASSSAITTLTIGKAIEQARNIAVEDVLGELGGVPEKKIHSVELAVEALQQSLQDYFARNPE